ncbi:major facilitator superfamily domain-containing protein [Mycena floridula]|nr:major facilitator superfamily domain-containing protein [Mycena floridula]
MTSLVQHRISLQQPQPSGETIDSVAEDELKLPKASSLVIILLTHFLLQITFFIVVSSTNEYAIHLGGTSTFSGVVIGIPTAVSALALIPLLRYDGGNYRMPLDVCCASSIIGMILYASAYKANWLYLILIGRCINGFGFAFWMYTKRYCTDSRIVGLRRRTTLASWLVMGQGLGMSMGPFAGGLLFKIGFKNDVFNGFTSPGWIMAFVWAIFWILTLYFYEDPPAVNPAIEITEISETSGVQRPRVSFFSSLTLGQWGTIFCMCWFALTCFFILGAWESNLPVFGASFDKFRWSPFAAGNFIALGGITTFPFLIVNLFVARRIQDRKILSFGTALGSAGLIVFLSLLKTNHVNYVGTFFCWWAVALGFNVASTVTTSLLSKQLDPKWNAWSSLAIQYSNNAGRVFGAVWGGSGLVVGMPNYIGLELGLVGIGAMLFTCFWRDLKARPG